MTCIVGVAHEGKVYIGGDRAASDGSSVLSMVSPKVYIRDQWIYGYAGTIGIAQCMNYVSLPIPGEGEDIERLIKTVIVPELKLYIESHSVTAKDPDTTWLLGANGQLFEFSDSDWSVVEVDFTAVGSGGNFALGSLHTSTRHKNTYRRVSLALDAAITYSPMCQGPIDVLVI
jgi:ATP-dependent protease HslVU (ClpYQ) peptidase subunit